MKTVFRPAIVFLASLAPIAFAGTSPAAPQGSKPVYPLTTCVVSDEALGSMGKPFEYVHKETGKPDRVVLFCCKSCTEDFKKAPAKHLAKVDAADVKAAGKK